MTNTTQNFHSEKDYLGNDIDHEKYNSTLHYGTLEYEKAENEEAERHYMEITKEADRERNGF